MLMSTMEKLTLSATQTKLLTDCVRASTSPQRLVQRAGMILDYAKLDNKSSVATNTLLDGIPSAAGVNVGRITKPSWNVWRPNTKPVA